CNTQQLKCTHKTKNLIFVRKHASKRISALITSNYKTGIKFMSDIFTILIFNINQILLVIDDIGALSRALAGQHFVAFVITGLSSVRISVDRRIISDETVEVPALWVSFKLIG